MDVLADILQHKIVAILRGAKTADVIRIARALHDGGIRLLEVTLNSPNALQTILELSSSMKGKMHIGAGTVLNPEETKSAINAGAQFIISPCYIPEVIHITRQQGVVSIPGAFTPSEIVNAYNSGGQIIKVFPASTNAGYIKDIRAPLPHIPLMPTGGITIQNIHEFQQAGAVAFGIGSGLINTKMEVTDEYLSQLVVKAKRFVQAVA